MRVSAALLALLFAASAARASLTVSALTGRIMAGERAASGVTVTLTSTDPPFTRSTITDAHGRYWVASVPPGRYEVTFGGAGLTSLSRPVVIELGRVARADARLERSEDEESVTSTAMPTSVVDTTALTTHLDEEQLDRFPYPRSTPAVLAPVAAFATHRIDDAPLDDPSILGNEALQELTLFRGGVPAEIGERDLLSLRVRRGTDRMSLLLRDTYTVTRPRGHLVEGAGGGRLIAERLWIFGTGWIGDTARARDVRGVATKLSLHLGATHDLSATWIAADSETLDTSTVAARYSGVGAGASGDAALAEDSGTAMITFARGSHVTRGGAGFDDRTGDPSFFVAHRWSQERLAVDAGLRHDGDLLPRIALAYGLRENGRQALSATHGAFRDDVTLTTLGFVTALGASAQARADVVRRTRNARTTHDLQVDAQYRFFDRLEAGAIYVWSDGGGMDRHRASTWLGVRMGIGAHELGTTIVERHEAGRWITDAAVRYAIPFESTTLTLAADATDVIEAATVRLWARLRY